MSTAQPEKEKVIIFDDNSLEAALLQKMFGQDYDFQSIKVKEFKKGDLDAWFENLKDKGTPEKRQKVFIGFSTEDSIANDIHKDLFKIQAKYPNLSISSILDGMHKDAVKERMNVRTDQIILRDVKMAISKGELKIEPDNNEAIQKEIDRRRQEDISKALGQTETATETETEKEAISGSG